MKRLSLALVFLILVLTSPAFAQTINKTLTLDVTQPQRAFSFTVSRGATFYLRCNLLMNGVTYTNPAGTGGYVFYSTNSSSVGGVYTYGTTAGATRIDFLFAPSNTIGVTTNNSTSNLTYFCQIVLTNSVGSYDWNQGTIIIRPSAAHFGAGAVNPSIPFNGSLYTFLNMPFMPISGGATGGIFYAYYRAADNFFNSLSFGSTVLSGFGNTVGDAAAVICGGYSNQALASRSIVVGGQMNKATGQYAAVLSGAQSTAGGLYSLTMANAQGSGYGAFADYSVAAGRGARTTNTGAWVISDGSSSADYTSSKSNSLLLGFAEGIYFGSATTTNRQIIDRDGNHVGSGSGLSNVFVIVTPPLSNNASGANGQVAVETNYFYFYNAAAFGTSGGWNRVTGTTAWP